MKHFGSKGVRSRDHGGWSWVQPWIIGGKILLSLNREIGKLCPQNETFHCRSLKSGRFATGRRLRGRNRIGVTVGEAWFARRSVRTLLPQIVMKSVILFLIATSVFCAFGQIGERTPLKIDFNKRIDGAEANRARLEKRLRAKTRPKRVARVSFGGEMNRRPAKPKGVRSPSAQTVRQSGAFELVMRPKNAK